MINKEIIIKKIEIASKMNLQHLDKQRISEGDEKEIIKLIEFVFLKWGLHGLNKSEQGLDFFIQWLKNFLGEIDSVRFEKCNLLDVFYYYIIIIFIVFLYLIIIFNLLHFYLLHFNCIFINYYSYIIRLCMTRIFCYISLKQPTSKN